jgi:hypothetical protein
MAGRLKLAANPTGMTFIYNVSQRVGFKEANLPDDVQLVQFFLREEMKSRADLLPLGIPTLSGKFDAVTGFYLYLWQNKAKRPIVDGVVSPAHGVHYGGSASSVWLIVDLNNVFRTAKPAEFEKLHENPELRASLRAAIAP